MADMKSSLPRTSRGLIYNDSHTLQTRGLIVLLVCKAAGQPSGSDQDIDNSQRALAEITEMIYTACLIHKGVVNMSDLDLVDEVLEGMSSGNKMATLTGDFLLANACTELARLENTQVVENISCAIGNSMEAEFTKIKNCKTDVTFDDWLDQTYLTSGSLLAHSCQSALLLVGHNESYQTAAFNLGKNLAITRQLYEDINKFTQPETDDISPQILSTAPGVLYLGNRSTDFSEEVLEDPKEQKKILKKIKESGELQQCKDLCKQYGIKARQSLHVFEHSVPRDALFRIINATTVS
ncbi:all trans-polyprenyl-diphosphate synthase PDSS2-like isoform X2 [Mytilus californianus]|uniref:all trans-polyprenyl-diphosphate synthase PDSS2-like isoform X2 n=1 Tax=Mytilus californianus TaxID=6549 RepID=UPI00224649F7|nr:all trans-polyprenyl-diphosphate synthase PDSS2-like isoform X2 [Mytilus californianus]